MRPNRLGRILVANRGEIAVRILRTARALGYATVAVYSEADAGSPHVRMADEALCLGPAPAADSYLNIERVVAAAVTGGCDAIHPGYGFLSENADFADAVDAAGLVLIGPPATATRLMGDKAQARRRMIAAGVPCVPGYQDPDQSDRALTRAAERIGYPVMVKAAGGGGGRGMRVVAEAHSLPAALARARSEARSAFGSDALILERALARPRHVEVQVLADAHGGCVHLGERDCSIQRRHQKIIEEAPCPELSPALRAAMGAAAVEAARSIDYRGAGTVEFLLDADEFYFLEMNTRLQVEHPVTEMISGLDLVAQQFRIAEGHPLGFDQDAVRLDGHAIEARLYAEDPAQDFLPASGRIECWQAPEGEGVRVDSGVETGSEIAPHYDPLIAKIIAWGPSREVARRRLATALAKTVLFGPTTNRDFLLAVLETERFAAGRVSTAFIADEYPDGFAPAVPETHPALAAALHYLCARDRALANALRVEPELMNWSSHAALVSHFRYDIDGVAQAIRVRPLGQNGLRVELPTGSHQIQVLERAHGAARVTIDGHAASVRYSSAAPHRISLSYAGTTAEYHHRGARRAAVEQAGGGRVTAPMHGVVRELFVATGDRVARGDRLLTLEAMKMQHELLAPIAGTVAAVHQAAGARVAAGQLVLEIASSEPGKADA